MISRYSKPEMAKIWSDENRFQQMLNVEIYAAEAMAAIGQIPKSVAANIKKKAKVNVKRINEIEATVKHETIAFLTAVGEPVGKDARYMHLGLTSNDALDTALAAQMREATKLLIKETKTLAKITKALALKYKMTPTMGRTHGVHAEPMTFGLKVLSWYSEVERSVKRLESTLKEISYGKISGAVGTMAHLDKRVEAYVCKKMELKPEPVSTQIIPRDRHSVYFSTLAHVGAALERIDTEGRHLKRTEVLEVEEPFSYGQKGSSTMPHKR
ncbi:MAG: lyase family protein, partial [Elusimicrobia bacterium]|nr:lyase family protein [Elusimicrobiota bacterium]